MFFFPQLVNPDLNQLINEGFPTHFTQQENQGQKNQSVADLLKELNGVSFSEENLQKTCESLIKKARAVFPASSVLDIQGCTIKPYKKEEIPLRFSERIGILYGVSNRANREIFLNLEALQLRGVPDGLPQAASVLQTLVIELIHIQNSKASTKVFSEEELKELWDYIDNPDSGAKPHKLETELQNLATEEFVARMGGKLFINKLSKLTKGEKLPIAINTLAELDADAMIKECIAIAMAARFPDKDYEKLSTALIKSEDSREKTLLQRLIKRLDTDTWVDAAVESLKKILPDQNTLIFNSGDSLITVSFPERKSSF